MGRPRSFDEAAAVSQAAALFAERGYDGTSVDDLVRGLGVHRGSLYSTFGSKRALYLRVLAEHVTTLDATAADDLTLLLRAAVERAPVDPDAAELVASGLAALQRHLERGSEHGTEHGSTTLARFLGEELIRRATPTDDQEAP